MEKKRKEEPYLLLRFLNNKNEVLFQIFNKNLNNNLASLNREEWKKEKIQNMLIYFIKYQYYLVLVVEGKSLNRVDSVNTVEKRQNSLNYSVITVGDPMIQVVLSVNIVEK